MSTSLNTGYTDSPITEGVHAVLTAAPLNFAEDFRVLSTRPGEATITNITSPSDRPEKIRFASNPISNIYQQTGVSPERFGPTKTGRSVLVQLTDVMSVQSAGSEEDLYQLPISMHLVMRVPNSEHITDEVILTQLSRLFGALYDTGVDNTQRLKGLVRGSLLPRDVV